VGAGRDRQHQPARLMVIAAARASEVLALDIEDLDARRAPVRSKGGDIEWIYWRSGTAHLLPRLLRTATAADNLIARSQLQRWTGNCPTPRTAASEQADRPESGRARI